MGLRCAAWVRYGNNPITSQDIDYAVEHCNVAILQPWEGDAAAELKRRSPDMTVLAYKCLSSVRSYEPGPVYSSGVSYAQAEAAESTGESWYAHRLDGSKIEWAGYSGHWQMAVWNEEYRTAWVESVVAEIADSPFDGVMGDNDIGGDYYGLNLPIRGADSMSTIYDGLGALIKEAGTALNKQGKILVPNVSESRDFSGKWEAHTAYGGGFEEVFLGWGAQSYLNEYAAVRQANEMTGDLPPVKVGSTERPRITIVHSVTDGSSAHPNTLAGLAGFWIFGGGNWTSFTATGHDSYDETPWIPEQGWNLGAPLEKIQRQDGGLYFRRFEEGWAALNLGESPVEVSLPPHNPDDASQQSSVVHTVELAAHAGLLVHRNVNP